MAIHIYLPTKKAAKVRDAAPAIGDKVKIHVNGQSLPGTVKAVRGNLISVAYVVIFGGEKFNRQDDFHVGKVFNTSGKAFSASAEDAKARDASRRYNVEIRLPDGSKKVEKLEFQAGKEGGYGGVIKYEVQKRYPGASILNIVERGDSMADANLKDLQFKLTQGEAPPQLQEAYNGWCKKQDKVRTRPDSAAAFMVLAAGRLSQFGVNDKGTGDSDPSLELVYAVERNPQDVGKRAKKQFSTEAEFLSALLKGGMSKNERCVQEALSAYRTKDSRDYVTEANTATNKANASTKEATRYGSPYNHAQASQMHYAAGMSWTNVANSTDDPKDKAEAKAKSDAHRRQSDFHYKNSIA